MNRLLQISLFRWLAGSLVFLACMAGATTAAAQNYGEPRFDRPALDAMLAPVALYPDPLLSHVLMAATYPNEVEEAARWLRDRPGISGDAAVRSSDGWDWDPSVRSLLAFPLVLQTLADHPRWTEDLGEAFLGQREDVMDTIQQLRRRALATGTLRSTETTRVVDNGYSISIEPAAPQTVHVPYYDPRVTYGAWWWPARPPMYWSRWPGYYGPAGRDPYVYWGPGISLSSGFFFGNFVWSRREVRVVDVRPYYYPRTVVIERQVVPGRPVIERRPPIPDTWRHDQRRRYGEDRREFARPNEDFRRDGGRPPEPPRPAVVAPPRAFDERRQEPREERRSFERRDDGVPPPARVAPAPRAPEAAIVVPAPSVAPPTPRPDTRDPRAERGNRDREEARNAPRPDTQRRNPEEDRNRRASPPPERTQPRVDANDEPKNQRRNREPRD